MVSFFRYPGWIFSEIFWISNYVYFKGKIHFVHYFFYILWKYSVCIKTFSGTIIHQFDQIRALRRSYLSFFLFLFTSTFCHWFQRLEAFLLWAKHDTCIYIVFTSVHLMFSLTKITYRKYPFLSNTYFLWIMSIFYFICFMSLIRQLIVIYFDCIRFNLFFRKSNYSKIWWKNNKAIISLNFDLRF